MDAVMSDLEDLEKVFVNELLCYVTMHMHTSTKEHLYNSIQRFYNLEEIIRAKRLLYMLFCTLGEFPRRKTSTTRSELSAHSEDIINAIFDLDSNATVMKFAAVNLDRLPKWAPNDLDQFAVMEKVTSLETRLKHLELVVSENKLECIQTKDRLNEMRSVSELKTPTYATVTSGKSGSAKPNVGNPEVTVPVPKMNLIKHVATPLEFPKGTPSQCNNVSVLFNHERGEKKEDAAPDPHGFMLQRHQRKQMRKRTVVTGTGRSSRVKGSPPPLRDFFVYRVDVSTNEDDIKSFLDDNNIKGEKIVCVSRLESKFHSFCLSVPVTEHKRVMDPLTWPAAIMVRRFYNKQSSRPHEDDSDNDTADEVSTTVRRRPQIGLARSQARTGSVSTDREQADSYGV